MSLVDLQRHAYMEGGLSCLSSKINEFRRY
jgi:hypothetical protein